MIDRPTQITQNSEGEVSFWVGKKVDAHITISPKLLPLGKAVLVFS